MALVIDGSSPISSNTAAQANTCAAFVPPDSPLFLAVWAGDTTGSDPGVAPSAASSPSQTWVTDFWQHPNISTPTFELGQAAIFHALIPGSSPGSTTVTVTNGESAAGQRASIMSVLVITGQDPVNPIGVVGGASQHSGTSISQTFTASITGGQGFLAVCDWNAVSTTGWTADTGCTMLAKGTLAGEISYGLVQRTSPDEVVGTGTSLGITGIPAGGSFNWAYVEIISYAAVLAASTSAGYPARGANAPMF